ncbi:tRNA (N6-isopentenyl adenosine(37)-C2)-methylthiotransferase MiaB [Pontivivens insulae]|uniref:tRNA-2-methylthio-N(6)-dimethylallyladenosine synthase n=1 Tax=Pontivivens insulae TaxID=1639689 RepID=A0A2R8AEB5_9RHOB|nr:tRNA (N6-isopentenyl adenosine(37)-C2)-methylthiotransferase MiaB [Pontivivens insulae]RED11799.1 tRNA-i(6)A37 thiotransferase enzyme MiaB [Pontivivens insulae]SPF30556.1 tRNA-2-methylthio-N(6)-dimethylallyladenosine synthase [Pontivivens insulae]
MSETKKLFVKTYGCQMNVYDSERMAGALGQSGYEETDDPSNADMILLNTCHIREKAAEKVYSELGRLRPLKDANPDLKIGVAGCVAQAEGEEIMRRAPVVDLVVGPQAYHRLPEMEAKTRTGQKALDTEFPEEDKFDHLPSPRGPKMRRAPAAFLTVQEGCDKFCAFCVVPYTRGAEVSRPAPRLLAEARDLVERGVCEVTLLGQNVNAYHGAGEGGDWSLARLVRELAKIDGLERIRYTTSHPNDMTDDLIEAHGEVEKLMPYLHLPVQAGSDSVLKGMNRKHTAESYLRLLERIRAARPDIALSGDFIVGFPGESDADFEDTLALCREVRYAAAFSFKYSPRPGTPASGRTFVSDEVASERLARLQALLTEHQRDFQQAQVGKTLPILIEKEGREPGQMIGKSPYLQAVHLDAAPDTVGQIIQTRIVRSNPNSLAGEAI